MEKLCQFDNVASPLNIDTGKISTIIKTDTLKNGYRPLAINDDAVTISASRGERDHAN